MRVRLGLVAEKADRFYNHIILLLYSLRKNGGDLKDIPVTLITNNEPFCEREIKFLKKHFAPIEFKTMPRLGAFQNTSKLNVFYAIDPSNYDVLLFMDCDTVVRKALDHMLDPIKNEGVQFLCRRGGGSDRNQFVDYDGLVAQMCGLDSKTKVFFEGKKEWPMFNSGVFAVTSEAVRKIRKDAIDFTYKIFNEWSKINTLEGIRFIARLYQWKVLKTRKKILSNWPIEQGAISLACVKSNIDVAYLDGIYNSWGKDDFTILHCFLSCYKFDRTTMYSEGSEGWIKEYLKSELPGKVFLAKIVSEIKREIPELGENNCP